MARRDRRAAASAPEPIVPLAARLWIPVGENPARDDVLVRSIATDLERFAHARFGRPGWQDGILTIGRFGWLTEPVIATPPDVVHDAIVAKAVPFLRDLIVCELYAPTERAGPMPAPHGTGLAAAYPDGMPKRSERRYLDWLLAVADRLAGVVQVPTGGIVIPDVIPSAREVMAQVWLTPEAMAHVVWDAGLISFLPSAPGVSAYALAVGPVRVEVSVPERGIVHYRVVESSPGLAQASVARVASAIAEATSGAMTDTWGLPID